MDERGARDGRTYDAAVIGGGIAGFATAARLAARGLCVVVFEAHHAPGGCAGYFRRGGFSFDVGATTLVDFEPGGVGAAWLDEIGMATIPGEIQPAYDAWLPDRVVRLWHDPERFAAERRTRLGDGPRQRAFWSELEHVAAVFWRAARRGCRLPLRGPHDAWRALRAIGIRGVRLVGDDTWPGLGTVACILASRFVAEDLAREAPRLRGARPIPVASTRTEALHATRA